MKKRALNVVLGLILVGTAIMTVFLVLGAQDWASVVAKAAPPVPVGVLVVDDVATTMQGEAVSLNVLDNDQSPPGYDLQLDKMGLPANGTRSYTSTGNVAYTPAVGFAGADSFTYTVNVCDTSCVQVPDQVGRVTVMVVSLAPNPEFCGVGCIDAPVTQTTVMTFPLSITHPNPPVPPVLEFPPGSVADSICIFYEEMVPPAVPTDGTPGGFSFAGRRFELTALVGGTEVPGYQFLKPVTMTVKYDEASLKGLDENTLELFYWDGGQWSTTGIEVVDRDPIEKILTVKITHLTDFALFVRGGLIYLPLLTKSPDRAPDLIVQSLDTSSDNTTLVIKNVGNATVVDGFWIDVYFNPRTMPKLNEPWDTIADYGAAWAVTTDIPAGRSLTLTLNDSYYNPKHSSLPPYPVGGPAYAFVDSLDYNTNYGSVSESNENNNVLGPVVSATESLGLPVGGIPQNHVD